MGDNDHGSPKPSGSENQMQVLSILSPDDIKAIGTLPKEAIAGLIKNDPHNRDKFLPEQFQVNQDFVRFMHHVIKTFGVDDPALKAGALQQQNGWMYIIDLRTPDGPQGRVPPEDIIGAFEVKQGQLVQDSYWANEKHLVFSAYGLVRLPPFLRDALIREFKRLKSG